MSSTMNRISKQLSVGTQQFSQHAVSAAQAAAASIVAGLRTCDERSGGNLRQFEIRIENNNNSPASRRTVNSRILMSHLVHSVSVASTGLALPSSSPDRPDAADVWGSHTFDLSFQLQTAGPSAGYLVAAATRRGSPISLRCRWKRKIANTFVDIPGVFGTEYPISADDIASKVIVEATAVDSSQSGPQEVTYAELGPFELDTAARRNLDNYLALGGTRFSVIPRSPGSATDRNQELVCHVSAEELKIIKPGPSNIGYVEAWTCKYGAEYPHIQINPHDLSSFELTLSPTEKLSLAAMTRSQRDLLVLTVRCFHGRQWLANSILLQHVALGAGKQLRALQHPPDASPRCDGDAKGEPEVTTDFLVVVQRLTSELHRSLHVAEKSVRERDRAQIEKNALEDDIAATIEAYQQLLAQATTTDRTNLPDGQTVSLEITQRAAHVAELEGKLCESQQQASKYLSELERLRKDFRSLQTRMSAGPDTLSFSRADPLRMMSTSPKTDGAQSVVVDSLQTEELKQRINLLQKAHTELLKEKENKDRDLERMRQSQKLLTATGTPQAFETLAAAKGALERRVTELMTQNEELSENFLYMKGKYDQLISAAAAGGAESPIQGGESPINKTAQQSEDDTTVGASQLLTIARLRETQVETRLAQTKKEVDGIKAELEAVVTERNRYQKQVQALTRDLEKTQGQFQALMELNRELEGGKSIAEGHLKQIQNLMAKTKQDNETVEALESTIAALQQQNKEKDALIEQLQKENEMFRSRLRKMAMA